MKQNFFATLVLIVVPLVCTAQSAGQLQNRKTGLPNGWALTPAGLNINIGDLPLNLVISHNKKYAAVTNNGQSVQSIELIDIKKKKVLDTRVIAKAWYGLKFSGDDRFVYASGGNDNQINRYQISNGKLSLLDSFVLGKKWPNPIGPAGIDVDDVVNNKLYVVTKENNSLYVFDLATKNMLHELKLTHENYTCLLSQNKQNLYISSWGGKKVIIYNVKERKISGEIAVGSHPNEMCLNRTGEFLYVANADDNSVSVISTQTNKVIETLNAALFPNAPSGSTSNGVALSEDGKKLFVANADNNCLAVFDVSTPAKAFSVGFIPVGWYPTNVKVVGKQILVTNGKGLSSLPNPHGPNPMGIKQGVLHHAGDTAKPAPVQYIAGLFKGTLSFVPLPGAAQQALYSRAVYQNTPYSKDKELNPEGEPGNPIPDKVGRSSPIKYVFYIIKENRTYDQVLSDVPGGNGDTSLLLFGEKITPNQHKIVKDFVLFDNFYVDAEVSADGHNWTMGAYATDYLEKTWPTSYGGRGGSYAGEGKRKIANNRDGFLWDHCARFGVSYRSYGEFGSYGKADLKSLQGKMATGFAGWDLSIHDTTRFRQWRADFDSLLAINAVPQFSSVRLGGDHTEGMRAGKWTPYAHVADNDLAVGMLVDYISKSAIWKETAIFIVEDDAQNGPDHVDAHRSTLYVVSPYVKRKTIDHTMYSTSGVLRTIELLLGLPPMTQYDAAAVPLYRSFTEVPDFTPYNFLPAKVDLNARNPVRGPLAAWSDQFDWSKEDAVPDLVFNDILWMGLKGTLAPPPTRSAFLNLKKEKKDDDD